MIMKINDNFYTNKNYNNNNCEQNKYNNYKKKSNII